MYNQNFDGVYCTCARPYPDPENENNDEMLQCVICEDWYHSKVRHRKYIVLLPITNIITRIIHRYKILLSIYFI